MNASASVEIDGAEPTDIDGILDLQARNQSERGGTLSHSFPRERIATMIAEMPVIVARRDGRIVGYLMSASLQTNADVPILRAMLQAYRGAPDADAYVYGPICVAEAERGRGLAGAMLDELRRRLPGREGILFIRRDNAASRKAHEKMGVRRVGEFTHDDILYDVLTYHG